MSEPLQPPFRYLQPQAMPHQGHVMIVNKPDRPTVRLAFTPYDPATWTEGDETSRTDCAWHAQTNELNTDAGTGAPLWTVEMPDGRKFSACENAGHDVLRQYAKRL